MEESFKDPKIMRHIENSKQDPKKGKEDKENMHYKMKRGVEDLEDIQKKLERYLNSKRAVFSRFFFLSDESLLEILAQTKNPLLVQPHVGKCLEGIDRLEFEKKDFEISKLYSPEKEVIVLKERICPESPENKGAVEKWMYELEVKMKRTMCRLAHDSQIEFINQYDRTLDIEWVKNWPAMTCISVDQWNWTMNSEKAINAMKTDKTAIKKYDAEIFDSIMYIVKIVRGKLDSNTKGKLGAICTLKVHNREIIEEFKRETNEKKMITNTETFAWQSQLR